MGRTEASTSTDNILSKYGLKKSTAAAEKPAAAFDTSKQLMTGNSDRYNRWLDAARTASERGMGLDASDDPEDLNRVGNVLNAGLKGSGGGLAQAAAAILNPGDLNTEDADATFGTDYKLLESEKVNNFKTRLSEKASSSADKLMGEASVHQETAKKGLGTFGSGLVDLGVAGTQLATDLGVAALTGGSALLPMGLRSFGSGAYEAKQAGADAAKQFEYGLASAGVEMATEKLANIASPLAKSFGKGATDDIVETLIGKLGKTPAGKTALKWLASATGEGIEEIISGVVNPAIQTIYTGESMGKSYSKLDVADVLYQGLIGAALGGLGGAVDVGSNYKKYALKTGTEMMAENEKTSPEPSDGRPGLSAGVGTVAPNEVSDHSLPRGGVKSNGEAQKKIGEADAREVVDKIGENISTIQSVNPVADLSGTEFSKSSIGIIEQVSEFFKSIGNKVTRSGFGDVILDKRGVKNDVAHGLGRAKAITFAAIPDVIQWTPKETNSFSIRCILTARFRPA
ncbi:MAG: hypothetical protein EOM14_08730 [Clostridia bacterium]|nr:hypothetical protein [Clostridia bacterium]